MRLMNKLEAKFRDKPEVKQCPLKNALEEMKGTKIEDLEKRLDLLK